MSLIHPFFDTPFSLGFSKSFLDDFSEFPKFFQNSIGRSDILELDDKFQYLVDIPGMGPDDINIEVVDNILTISGKLSSENTEESGGKYHHFERKISNFSRSFYLPEFTEQTSLVANIENGLLTIEVPKVEPPQKEVFTVPITQSINHSQSTKVKTTKSGRATRSSSRNSKNS